MLILFLFVLYEFRVTDKSRLGYLLYDKLLYCIISVPCHNNKSINQSIVSPEYLMSLMQPRDHWSSSTESLLDWQVMKREPPLMLFGEPVKEPMFYTSHSNVDRIQILREYGGMLCSWNWQKQLWTPYGLVPFPKKSSSLMYSTQISIMMIWPFKIHAQSYF